MKSLMGHMWYHFKAYKSYDDWYPYEVANLTEIM